MTISAAFTGTEAVATTEHSLTTDTAGPDVETSDGVFQLWLNVADMIAGDQLQVRLYEKVLSSDAQELADEWILTGAQTSKSWKSPCVILLEGWDFTLDALAGTITVTWSIRKVA